MSRRRRSSLSRLCGCAAGPAVQNWSLRCPEVHTHTRESVGMKRALETDAEAVRELSLPLPDDMHHHLRDGEVRAAHSFVALRRMTGRPVDSNRSTKVARESFLPSTTGTTPPGRCAKKHGASPKPPTALVSRSQPASSARRASGVLGSPHGRSEAGWPPSHSPSPPCEKG